VIAEKAAVVSLQNSRKLEQNAAQIINQRERLFSSLKAIPWLVPYPSHANFILCRVTTLAAVDVYQQLQKQGILIRYFNKPGLSDHIRISIGTEEQMDNLVDVLRGLG
jgi:histidinol-phosphate aminotransferase